MTGMAPRQPATVRAKALAPPLWPESRGMTNRPASSTASTPGSVSLDARHGAISRVTAPAARKKTSCSQRANSSGTRSDSGPSKGSSQRMFRRAVAFAGGGPRRAQPPAQEAGLFHAAAGDGDQGNLRRRGHGFLARRMKIRLSGSRQCRRPSGREWASCTEVASGSSPCSRSRSQPRAQVLQGDAVQDDAAARLQPATRPRRGFRASRPPLPPMKTASGSGRSASPSGASAWTARTRPAPSRATLASS